MTEDDNDPSPGKIFPRVRRPTLPYPTEHRAPPNEQLGLGVVGLHEGQTALVAAARTRNVRAVAGCDLDADARATVAAQIPGLETYESYEKMLERDDIDIVGIYTPDAVHGTHIAAAFHAGKHVVCTKPVVNTIADAQLVVDAQRATGRRLMVGQSCRFFEPFMRQRRGFEHGEIGDIEIAEAHYVHRMDWYYAARPWVATDSDWIYLGLSHPLDLMRWYLGPLETVSAFGRRSQLGDRAGLVGNDIYSVNLRSIRGVIGRVMGNYSVHELARARNSIECLLYGSNGSSLAQYHDMRYLHTAQDGTEIVEDSLYEYRYYYFNNDVHGMHYGEFANYLQYFAERLIDGQPNSPDLREGIETFCVMEAARQSAARDGEPVPVSELTDQVIGLAEI